MRSIWNAVSFLAVVNLLALLLLGAWLWHTGRLTGARVQDMRHLLATTEGDAKNLAAQSLAEAELARLRQAEEAARLHPPMESAAQIQQIALIQQEHEMLRRRLEDERRLLALQLEETIEQLEMRAEDMKKGQSGRDMAAQERQRQRSDEQFLRAVRQIEQISPKQGRKFLESLATRGDVDQAVAYLDAMNSRAAARVLREFKTETEMELATELLERLRTRGVTEPEAPSLPRSGAVRDADVLANADPRPTADADGRTAPQ